jgi:microcystin-dependent protein
MKIYVIDNFKIGIKKFLDDRTNVKTLAELTSMSTNIIPYGLMVYCEEDDTIYRFSVDDVWVPMALSLETLFFQFNEETQLYDIPIYIHNPKVIEHCTEEVEGWLQSLYNPNRTDMDTFVNNDIIVDSRTWNALKFREYYQERTEQFETYVNNSLVSVVKPTYKKVNSETEMMDTGYFYVMETSTNSGEYSIYVVTDDGEVLSISSTEVDMSDYQPKEDENLATKNKTVVGGINEVNALNKSHEADIGINEDNNGAGMDGVQSTLSKFVGDCYVGYTSKVGKKGSLVSNNKDYLVDSINEIVDKIGDFDKLDPLIKKENITNSINYLYEIYKIKPGTIMLYGGATAPEGFLVCDGQELNPNDYPDLYNVIGSTYGLTTDGKFKVPDMKGRVPVGVKKVPQYNEPGYLNDKGGEKTVELWAASHIPSHKHTLVTNYHDHSEASPGVKQYTNETNKGYYESWKRGDDGNDGSGRTSYSNETYNHKHSGKETSKDKHKHTCVEAGEGKPHNNLMPYITLNYIIKY